MSYGVACERKTCRHYEDAHIDGTGACTAKGQWGECNCPEMILPADADEQRAFAKTMDERFYGRKLGD